MAHKAAITINRPRDEVERAWQSSDYRTDGGVSFRDAPGGRGTEIHVDLSDVAPGKLASAVKKVRGSDPIAKAKDDLRRFKQQVETGVIAVSEGSPEGELLERKFKQRPAQPLDESELEKAGA